MKFITKIYAKNANIFLPYRFIVKKTYSADGIFRKMF